MLMNKVQVISDLRQVLDELFELGHLEKKEISLRDDISIIEGLIEKLVRENALIARDQSAYIAKYNGLLAKHESLKSELNLTINHISNMYARKRSIEDLIARIEEQEDIITTFDDELWLSLVDSVVIKREGGNVIQF